MGLGVKQSQASNFVELDLDQKLIAVQRQNKQTSSTHNRELEKNSSEPFSAAKVMAKYALIWAGSPKSKRPHLESMNFSDAPTAQSSENLSSKNSRNSSKAEGRTDLKRDCSPL